MCSNSIMDPNPILAIAHTVSPGEGGGGGGSGGGCPTMCAEGALLAPPALELTPRCCLWMRRMARITCSRESRLLFDIFAEFFVMDCQTQNF